MQRRDGEDAADLESVATSDPHAVVGKGRRRCVLRGRIASDGKPVFSKCGTCDRR